MSSSKQEQEQEQAVEVVAVWVNHVALSPEEEAAVLRAYKLLMSECDEWTHKKVSRACAEAVVQQLTWAGVEARIIEEDEEDKEPSSYRFA